MSIEKFEMIAYITTLVVATVAVWALTTFYPI